MSAATAPAPAGPAAATAPQTGRRPGVWTVYRWEMRKLRYQKRTYLGLGAAMLVPCIFIVALLLENGGGGDGGFPFARYVRETGLAVPLVGLLFGSVWLFPLITALVAGDIVASEDGQGTLKTILTRSLDRTQIFAGKVLAAMTYAVIALAIFGGTGLVLGCLAFGFDPLVGLSGNRYPASEGLLLVLGSMGAYLLPTIAIASIALMLSTLTKNSAASVVGALMFSLILQLLGIIDGLEWLRPYLLSEQFSAWLGLARDPIDWEPIVTASWVCALYAVPALVVAWLHFLRRDVAGG
ncbi:MAG TPA: ABC transporter permease [Solirubrobacteraceae bacterium]|nr:ABC transporter permease [Solirubrobacteraceae bacterium]